MSERQKMLAGQLYDAMDPELVSARLRARRLLAQLNGSDDTPERGRTVYASLFGAVGRDVYIQPPFFCDYGTNIYIGNRVFFNFNCVILDCATVHIGDDVLFGQSKCIRRPIRSSGKPAPQASNPPHRFASIATCGLAVGLSCVPHVAQPIAPKGPLQVEEYRLGSVTHRTATR